MDERDIARWLTQRLAGDRGRADWRRFVEAGWRHLEKQKLSAILPAKEVEALYAAYLTPDRLSGVVHAAIREGLIPSVREMRTDRGKTSRWVPADARAAILQLVSRKGLMHPAWIKSVFAEQAIENILSDTLYGALRDFSTIIPRMIQNLSPVGVLGKIGGLGTKLMDEVEKRIEPEIRRFLEKGTRKALDGAARFTIEHLEDPSSIAFRRNMVAFMLDQESAFHVNALSEEVLQEIDRISEPIARHIASTEEARTRVHQMVARTAERHGERTIAEVLKQLGVTVDPPFDAWAEVTFPAIAALVTSPHVEDWLEQLVREVIGVIADQ